MKMKKNKKTIWIIALMLSLGMIIPLVSAYNIQYFMEDMEANPSDYYILHNRVEPELTSPIQSFADSFGVQVSDVEIPSKNLIAIAFEDDTFGGDYVWPDAVSYAEFKEDGEIEFTEETEMTLAVWITVEMNYYEYFPETSTELEAYTTNLNAILNRLSDYDTPPIENNGFSVAHGQVTEERMPTCSEMGSYDWDFYSRDRVYWWGELLEDYCIDNILMELECTGTGMEYKAYDCTKGCAAGFCIYTSFWLIEQATAGRLTYPEFSEGINSWIDSP
jgi:hypothetical protein